MKNVLLIIPNLPVTGEPITLESVQICGFKLEFTEPVCIPVDHKLVIRQTIQDRGIELLVVGYNE